MTVACASCGAEHADGARYCTVCGAPLQLTCPVCGSVQQATAAFCSSCGTALQRDVRRAEPAAAGEERRVVTVLFADLAGSTALGERLDPEDVRTLQSELFELVNTEVERFGGITEKFAGDAVLAVFGVPQTHEDDAERAVRAALATSEAFESFAARVQERHEADVGLRIGVNTGEVVSAREAAARGELMVSGDAVNVAARLQQHAAPGEVVVGERTYGATRRVIEYSPRDATELKGKRDPVVAWTAVAATAEPVRRGIEGLSAPLIGRDEELAVLAALATRVERERVPQLVTLFGQAGIGKSRLLAEFIPHHPQARVLSGRCLPYGDGITYWPLAEAAKEHAGILDTDSLQVAEGKLRAAVEGVVSPEHAASVAEAAAWTIGLSLPAQHGAVADTTQVRAWLLDAWSRFVTALGQQQFTIVVVEDIHWASEPLLDLLAHLTDSLEDTAVLIACPTRPELLDVRPSWGAGQQNATALNLRPLPPEAAHRLVAALLHADRMPPEARGRILERAEGNPFFVEEIVRMLIDRGALERRNGEWSATGALADVPIPDSVHGVIAARLDLLDAPARDALRRCSVVGRSFWPEAVGADEALLSSLVRRGLVSEQAASTMAGIREFTFKHALTRDVAYGALPRAERRRLHRRVGEWIERAAPDRSAETAELAAYHYDQAISYGENDAEVGARAFELLLAAGEAALVRAAPGSATALLSRAAELAPDDHARCVALVALARVRIAVRESELALEQLRDARLLAERSGDANALADVLSWTSRACWLTGRWAQALDSVTAAVAALDGQPETPQFAWALARRSQIEMLRSRPEAVDHATEAIAVARRVGDVLAEINARTNLFTMRANRGEPPDEGELHAVVDLALAAGAHDEAFRAIVNFAWSALPYSLGADVERSVGAALSRLPPIRAPEMYEFYLQLSRATLLLVPASRWREADRIAAEIEEPTGQASTHLLWLELIGGLALRRGDLQEAERRLEDLKHLALASEELQRIVPMACLVLPLAAMAGDVATLREVTEAVLERADADWVPVFRAYPIAQALAKAGELATLESLAHVVRPSSGAAAAGHQRVTVAVADGLLALAGDEPDEAAKHLDRAIELERSLGRVYYAACLELDLARALDETGDTDGARDARARAAAVLEPLACVNPV